MNSSRARRRILAVLTAVTLWGGALGAAPALAAETQADERRSSPGVYEGYAPVLYDEWVRESQYVAMRDGTRLAVDVYRPAVDGVAVDAPHPVVWEHQLSRASVGPTGEVRLAGVESGMAELTKYGYVVAFVDRRGNGASFGTMRGYHARTEARDAYDVMEWFADQPWATDRIGVFGCSNTGEAAMHAATAGSPHLRAVFAGNYSFHKYDGFNRGGIRANWGVGPSRTLEQDLTNLPVDADADGSLLYEAALEHRANTSLRDMWRAAPFRDSRVEDVDARPWQDYSVATYRDAIERSGVALYSWDGWQDDFRKEVLVSAASLDNPHKVLIGPWGHCGSDGFDIVAERHRFFDYWLKDIDNGIMDEPAYTWFVQGGDGTGRWRQSDTWPGRGKEASLYLGEGRTGTTESVNDGALTLAHPRGRGAADEYRVDYGLTCPAPVGLGQTCPQDEHGLTYTTDALASDVEVTGHPELELALSSTAPDQNVFVYLEDVAPDGSVRIVTDGRVRAALSAERDAPWDVLGTPWHRAEEADYDELEPGEPRRMRIDLLPTSYVFAEGHRIRVTITGADVRESMRPEFEPQPLLTVHRDAVRASKLVLPVDGAAGDVGGLRSGG
jgi:putative CocE/NonD family hydrolase